MSSGLRVAILGGLLAVVVAIIAFAGKPVDKDYVSYWSAAKLVAQHADPYGAASVLSMEKSQGYEPDKPLIMRNPPWALVVIAPLRFVSLRVGLVLWTAGILFCMVLSFRLLHVPSSERLMAYIFAPVYACISSGQSSAFLLLGVVLFFVYAKRRSPIAGAGLALMALKPHLFLVLWPIVLIECIRNKSLRVLAVGFAILAAVTALAYGLAPHAWPQYIAMLHSSQLSGEFLQTPSYLLRWLIAPSKLWLQLVPSAIAVVWACWYYWRHRSKWDWLQHGYLVLLVSVIVSPYAWVTDEIVLLPLVIAVLVRQRTAKDITAAYIAINGITLGLLLTGFQLSSGAYIWTPLAWGAWYLYGTRRSQNPCQDPLTV